jgi:hypothetical protein
VKTNKSHHCCSKYVVLEQVNELKTIRLELLSSFGQPEDFDGPLKTVIGNSKHHRDKFLFKYQLIWDLQSLCGGARMELSGRNHDKGNGDLRKRSLDLMKKKDNLEGIMMNSRDFLRR